MKPTKKEKVLAFLEKVIADRATTIRPPEHITAVVHFGDDGVNRYEIAVQNTTQRFVVCSFNQDTDWLNSCWDKAYFFLGLELLELKEKVKVFAEGVVAPI